MAVLAVAASGCQPIQALPAAVTRTDVISAPIGNQQIVEGGNLVMALSAEPDRLDPTTSSALYTRYVMQTICRKLCDIDDRGKIVPQLATALPKVSEDGLTVTIPVRTGTAFADGTAFNADAACATIERGLTMKGSARKSELGPISSVKTVDETTLQITYKKPFAPIPAALADRAGMILSPKAVAEAGANFGDHPPSPGIMLSDAQQYIFRSPTAAIIPGVGIAVICLAFNLFGDALRDALDPAASSRK
ncbi:ABC-type transport system substrate-binding protein [Arthrobacter sp. GAS37]|uniref:ABC transporter substrate-binding protein n=1 Tax=Arthrobacter sp. GAS37 TaxID=3156261 RepID=UPI003836D366